MNLDYLIYTTMVILLCLSSLVMVRNTFGVTHDADNFCKNNGYEYGEYYEKYFIVPGGGSCYKTIEKCTHGSKTNCYEKLMGTSISEYSWNKYYQGETKT